jgi:hypothetical protein
MTIKRTDNPSSSEEPDPSGEDLDGQKSSEDDSYSVSQKQNATNGAQIDSAESVEISQSQDTFNYLIQNIKNYAKGSPWLYFLAFFLGGYIWGTVISGYTSDQQGKQDVKAITAKASEDNQKMRQSQNSLQQENLALRQKIAFLKQDLDSSQNYIKKMEDEIKIVKSPISSVQTSPETLTSANSAQTSQPMSGCQKLPCSAQEGKISLTVDNIELDKGSNYPLVFRLTIHNLSNKDLELSPFIGDTDIIDDSSIQTGGGKISDRYDWGSKRLQQGGKTTGKMAVALVNPDPSRISVRFKIGDARIPMDFPRSLIPSAKRL